MLDFICIGAQKAGTSWLYTMLAGHPDIHFPSGKEVHFWDYYYDNGLDWYRGLFAGEVPPGCRQGDMTPAYAILPRQRIAEVHQHFPHLRLLYVLRNPLERAWSSALMALARAEMTPDEASDQWFIDHFNSRGSLRRGDYAACLEHWWAVFPRQQCLLCRYDRIQQAPRDLLLDVARHLAVDTDYFEQLPEPMLRQRVFASAGPPLRPSLKPYLQQLYREPCARLVELLGEEWSWSC